MFELIVSLYCWALTCKSLVLDVFYLQIKSMAEHLNKTQKLDTPRQMRFNDKPFVEDIEALMNLVNKEVTDKYIKVKG